MPVDKQRPDLAALLSVLIAHDVRFVITGSTAAMLHGVELTPGDLDITPALDSDNLNRLALALESLGARLDADSPFGEWQSQPDGELCWIQRDARPGEREALLEWRPDPSDASTFDHLFVTDNGALDVVPLIAGRYEDLARTATRVSAFGQHLVTESIEDLLATLTVPRRAKDRRRVLALRDLQRQQAG